MEKKIICLIISFFSFFIKNTAAQENYKGCGLNEQLEELYKENPKLKEEISLLMKNSRTFKKNKSGEPIEVYTIPVVFHIIHEYGTENISDAQVFDEMIVLNRDYRMMNSDTSEIDNYYDTTRSDVYVEFKLASKDPWGNCTNGIEHIYSHLTTEANDDSKLNGWHKSNYLNVWVVSSLENHEASAYAYFPSNDLPFYRDGVIIINDYVGRLGTGQNAWSRTLTHEIGHYLALPHVWGEGKCELEPICGDDGILDTPPTKGYTTCSINNSHKCNAEIPENLQNYMDYSFCNRMFTKGQVEVMRFSLASTLGGRNNLVSDSNHILTGINVLSPPTCSPKADFHASDRFICQGANVIFNDVSWRATVDSRIWTFEGGTPSTSTSISPNVVYDTPGYKKVRLSVQNSIGTDELIQENFIFVSPLWADFTGPYSNDLESGNFNWFLVDNPENNYAKFQVSPNHGYNNTQCFKLNNYKNTSSALAYTNDWFYDKRLGYGKDALISPSFDLTHTANASISFKYAYASNGNTFDTITEVVKVYVSKNCGESWVLRKTMLASELLTAGFAGNIDFIPQSNSQWKTCVIPYNASGSDYETRVKIEFVASDFANNLYIDNFNITGTLGLFTNEIDNLELSVYPNPLTSQQSINVAYTSGETPVELILKDLQGKVIHSERVNELNTKVNHILKLDTLLSSSCYFLEVKSGNFSTTKKIVIL